MLSITYLSAANPPMSVDQLQQLLAEVRAKNERLGITGVLLYADGNFVQTIEGPASVVEETYARITEDPRHRGVIEAWRDEPDEQTFPSWTMGFTHIDEKSMAQVPGFNDFLHHRRPTVAADGKTFTAEVFFRIFRDGISCP